MHEDDIAASPRCICCHSLLFADELGRQACFRCEDRTGEHLAQLAGPEGLYARLSGSLAPGRAGSGPSVSGSRTAPLPLRLEPLSLMARGGVVTILQTWLVDWHELLGWTYPRFEGDLRQQCDQVVARLRANLPWAAEQHPAFDEFAREVAHVEGACRRQVTGERPERRVTVVCHCGQPLRVTVSTPGARCRSCDAQYGHDDVFRLPLAERSAA